MRFMAEEMTTVGSGMVMAGDSCIFVARWSHCFLLRGPNLHRRRIRPTRSLTHRPVSVDTECLGFGHQPAHNWDRAARLPPHHLHGTVDLYSVFAQEFAHPIPTKPHAGGNTSANGSSIALARRSAESCFFRH